MLARGRWSWQTRPGAPADTGVTTVTCPACQRIRDRDPVHVMHVEGLLPAQARDVRALARSVERAESASHPQERLVPLASPKGSLAIGTTGLHLARRLLAAIRRSWKRQIEVLRRNDVETRLGWQPVAVRTR